MGLLVDRADLLRTAGLPAIRVARPSAGRAPDRVSQGILSRAALLPVRHSLPGASTAASAVLARVCDSEPASEATAITMATDV